MFLELKGQNVLASAASVMLQIIDNKGQPTAVLPSFDME